MQDQRKEVAQVVRQCEQLQPDLPREQQDGNRSYGEVNQATARSFGNERRGREDGKRDKDTAYTERLCLFDTAVTIRGKVVGVGSKREQRKRLLMKGKM